MGQCDVWCALACPVFVTRWRRKGRMDRSLAGRLPNTGGGLQNSESGGADRVEVCNGAGALFVEQSTSSGGIPPGGGNSG